MFTTKQSTKPLLVSFLCICSIGLSSAIVAETELETEAVSIAQRFGASLKPELLNAVQTGGLEHAIEVCSVQAPYIAKQLSEETGWEIKRVSLKPRNTNSAIPDDYELSILEDFNNRLAQGEPAASITKFELVEDQYRFMKAQPVEGLCLNCHGDTISPEVQQALKEHFPEDVATGYSLGDIRGAFSFTKDQN